MNYLLAGELFTKINHQPIDLHFKINIFSIFLSLYFQLPTIWLICKRLPVGPTDSLYPDGNLLNHVAGNWE